jgi:hypothetical protein
LVIKHLKKIIKNKINNQFIDVFDGQNKEWIELENIILFGPYGIPITSNFKIIYSSMGTIGFAKIRLRYTIKEYGLVRIVFELIKVKVFNFNLIKSTSGLLIPRAGLPGLPNYGHYLCEDLPKIKIYKEWENKNNSKLKLILGPYPERKWLNQFLKLFDYNKDELIINKKLFLKVSTLVMAKLYYIHAFSFQSNPNGIKWVGDTLKNKILKGEEVERANIFIDRRKVYRRHVTNYNDLIPLLKKYNFITVDPEDYSVEEQIKLFSAAKIISGPSGAAFANMIFAKNAIIINSYFILNKMNCWENLSLDMGFKYIPVRTNAVIRNQKPDHFQDLEIDIKHFENILASISPTTINSN